MFTRRVILRVLGAAVLLLSASPVAAQEVVVTGPPPELRKNLDAFMKAFNSGSADQFETMAAAAFTPEYLKSQTAAARKAAFAKMVKEFGTIKIERVERNGPEAPLEAFVKGTVASGVFWIELDESSRFAGIRTEVVKVPSPQRMRIVVIEDDAVVAETLTLYLERAGFSVTAAADGVSGLALALGPEVSLVILDLMIPRIGGREVCRQIRLSSAVPVLMLTARASEDDRVAGLEIGADDYVAKPFSPREVVARVQALIRRTGSQPTAPPPIVIGDLQLDLWARRARLKNRVLTLTPTEFKLLEVLGRSPGRVFTREELLARAFGPGYDGLDRTVDVHITNLRRKLEPGRQPKYILTEHGIGYRLATADDF